MPTVYLSQNNKNRIIHNMTKIVREKLDKLPAAREFAKTKEALARKVAKIVQDAYPEQDMEVLQKYGALEYNGKIGLALRMNKSITIGSSKFGHMDGELQFCFEPALETPSHLHIGSCVERLLQDEENPEVAVLTKEIQNAIAVHKELECDVKQTVRAFSSRLGNLKTLNQLLKAYPDMEKLIPEEMLEPVENIATTKPEDNKRIEKFQELVSEDPGDQELAA